MINKLLLIAELGLAAAGVIFLIVSVLGDGRWILGAALGCVVLAYIFQTVRKQVKKKLQTS